jgi:putative ribosome biogenesis GTPase RsgA
MEIYQKSAVHIMWEEHNKIARQKGVHKTNFSALESINLEVGDLVVVNSQDRTAWEIVDILEKRPSLLSGRDYYVTNSKFVKY